MVIGRVLAVQTGGGDGAPLVSWRGWYASLSGKAAASDQS